MKPNRVLSNRGSVLLKQNNSNNLGVIQPFARSPIFGSRVPVTRCEQSKPANWDTPKLADHLPSWG